MHVELLKGFMGGKYQDIQLRDANCSLLRFVKGCVADGSEDKVLESPLMFILSRVQF